MPTIGRGDSRLYDCRTELHALEVVVGSVRVGQKQHHADQPKHHGHLKLLYAKLMQANNISDEVCRESYRVLSVPFHKYDLGYPFNRTHCKLRRRGLEKFGYVHDRHSLGAARARGEDPAELLPAVHQVVSLAKRWLLGTHQGSVDEAHLASYLNEFVFRFNRRRSRSRGMVFYRVLELAVAHDPVRYQDLIATKRPRAVPSTPPQGRGHPPSLERPPAKRPSRTAGLDGSG